MAISQTTPASSNLPSKRDNDIDLILSLLQNKVNELKENVIVSKELLCAGVKTELATQIEKTIENPLFALTTVKKDIDSKIKTLINALLKSIFSLHNDVIKEVYRSGDSDLYYCIVLREDKYENRNKVFTILDAYESFEFAALFPVDFQFVPADLSANIRHTEKLTF